MDEKQMKLPQYRKEEKELIPDVATDPSTLKRYAKGKFLGKGGFGRCFEFTDLETNTVYAGKIIAKSILTKEHHRQKMVQEIEIHRSVSHRHIVRFHKFFEDDNFVYILLELCRRRSLMELQKRRKAITEAECRYFVRQIATACDFLHKARIIHRDLKLGNLFLNDNMEIKIGDFGLATRLDYVGERKRTLCGTPNYIAPEVLGKRGHSYEVDSWSLGCIIYTLLIGTPPFETMSLKDTYNKIRRNEYEIPSRVSSTARVLIRKLLQSDPSSRPTMEQVLADEFLTSGLVPNALPTSSLTVAPRFDQVSVSSESAKHGSDTERKLHECNGSSAVKSDVAKAGERPPTATARPDHKRGPEIEQPADCYLSDLFAQLKSLTSANPSQLQEIAIGEAEDPAAVPIYWISKWVDYSEKYGLGYQLSDNSVGVLFNDNTRLILTNQAENLQYIERDGQEHFHTYKTFPDALTKKMTLLKYFRNYMTEHLLKAGENLAPREGDAMIRLPFLRTWYRTRSAIVLHLSNGTLQINFFADHTKIIFCPLMGAVTYIDASRQAHTYRFLLLEKFGCTEELETRLKYGLTMVEKLLSARHSSSSNALVAKREQ